jgi:hypothetical protein
MDGKLDKETTISFDGGPAVPLDVAMAAMGAGADKVLAKPKTETRSLMCRLTDDEQRVRGVDLADQQKLLADLTEQKPAIGDQIKDAQAKIDRLAETVKHRQEERPVTCLMTPDYSADSMTITRTDNGEIVAVRQLTHGERQPELPLDAKK